MLTLKWHNIAILVVDDNAFMRNLIVSTVRALGMTNVIAKSSAPEAIAALRVVFNDRVRGNGSKIGADLLKDNEQAVHKYSDTPLAGAAA